MSPEVQDILDAAKELFDSLTSLSLTTRIKVINRLKQRLHKVSPFAAEPVDCVLWVPAEQVAANDYNPNTVAGPEMDLLETSIRQDGYTQPIVAWHVDDRFEVVDGFHRNRIGKEREIIRQRILGYLPITLINAGRRDKADRIASTIRHNRARGKHRVDAMSDIVVELKRRNWTDAKIGKELGMEPDEVLRLCQISGLTELFHDDDFSQSWDLDDDSQQAFEGLSDTSQESDEA